ncbi:MAG: glycosyltransferase family 87 protein [Longimicrobiales bacterium]|nr:glycosyltransferase family 87 protein [Longimicrobiales bacterium]
MKLRAHPRTTVALLAAIVVFLQVGWFTGVLTSPDPAATAHRDWIQFHRTAERLVQGATDEIYPVGFEGDTRPEFSDGLFFLYPPFVAWVTLPLALLSALGAYLACAAAVAVVTLAAVRSVLRTLGERQPRRLLGLLWGMASAPWNAAVILGHLSATLLASPALALAAWSRGNERWTGAGLGLLLAKPNWGLPVLLLLLVGRRWRMVGGFLASAAALVVVSLPLGPDLWGDWVITMVNYRTIVTDSGATQPWRQATLFATLQSLFGRPGSDPWMMGAWLAAGGGLFGATVAVWARHGRAAPTFPRLLGVALLAILVTNPYAYFYDALLAFPAAAALWSRDASWRRPRLRSIARGVTLAIWAWMHLQYFVLMNAAPSLVGLGLAAWLVLEIVDLGASDPLPPPGALR